MSDRAWLLTWTCYGTWLPGDQRGFVGFHYDTNGQRVIKNDPDTEYAQGISPLRRYAANVQRNEKCLLSEEQATLAAEQFAETAGYRGWRLIACAVMTNHVHIVVVVPDDPDPEAILHSFKSYTSRRLNQEYGRRYWWTKSGSTRKLPDESAIRSAVRYVKDQPGTLIVRVDDQWLPLPSPDQASPASHGGGERPSPAS
jgi:REP element-mobilizing transposase RayT